MPLLCEIPIRADYLANSTRRNIIRWTFPQLVWNMFETNYKFHVWHLQFIRFLFRLAFSLLASFWRWHSDTQRVENCNILTFCTHMTQFIRNMISSHVSSRFHRMSIPLKFITLRPALLSYISVNKLHSNVNIFVEDGSNLFILNYQIEGSTLFSTHLKTI